MSTMNQPSSLYDDIILGSASDTFTIDVSSLPNYNFSTMAASPYLTTSITNGSNSTLQVNGDANIDGDLKVKGKSILDTLEKIEERLLILQPDPAKLEKYEALRKAYEQYKILESLIGKD